MVDTHAKRLKMKKSSRITISDEDKMKPSRFARAMAALAIEPPKLDLTFSDARTEAQSSEMKKA